MQQPQRLMLLIALLLLAACGTADAPAGQAARTTAAAQAVAPTQAPATAAPATSQPATASASGDPVGGAAGGPCDARRADTTPTATPPERNDLGEPADPCATSAAQTGDGQAQPGSGGVAQPCPGGPADDHPPALPQPTQVGAIAGCATAQPIGVTVVVAQGGATSTPTPLQGQRTIGMPSQQTTVELAVGETFELKLGGGMDWTVQIDNQSVIAREPGAVTPDSQGVYRALAAGSTKLRAAGDPTCLKSNPPCAAPSFLFEITIVVR